MEILDFKKLASRYFHGEEGYNCAQAVLKIFQDHYQVSDEMITQYKQNGGGRVEGNTCGALYAAQKLNPKHSQQIAEEFSTFASYETCHEIKTISKYSCLNCVIKACEALHSVK